MCVEEFGRYSNFNFEFNCKTFQYLVLNILLAVICVEGFCRHSNFNFEFDCKTIENLAENI